MINSSQCEQVIFDNSLLLVQNLYQYHTYTALIFILVGFYLGKYLGERNYFRVQPETINGVHISSFEEIS